MTNPQLLVIVQLLDGVTAAVFSVMVPLVVADLTRGTGHFNLGQGFVGTFVGIGASLSATFAGYISDRFGSPAAFAGLAAIACSASRWCGFYAGDAAGGRGSRDRRSPRRPIGVRRIIAPELQRRRVSVTSRRCGAAASDRLR